MELELIKNHIHEIRGFASLCSFAKASAQAKATRKQDQKFDDIEQVLKYLIQKDNQKTQQTTRKQVGYKK